MKTILVTTLAIILVTGAVLLGWYYYLKWKFKKTIAIKYKVVGPLIKKLAGNEALTKTEILVLARDPALRHAVYRVLEAYDRHDLFPGDFLSVEKGAESFLVTWLEFPTELGEAPHEIELFTTVALDELVDLTYYVFKYRMHGNHWAARYDWMFGIAGPYGTKSNPFDVPSKIFSRFNSIEQVTAEEEVRWVHDNIL